MDFSFITFPLELRLSIPSKPRIDLTGGVYYSFVKDYSLSYYSSSEALKKKDMGYKWTAALSYPLAESIEVSLGTAYYNGRTKFLEYNDYRHGHIDFTLGLSYNGFFKKEKGTLPFSSLADTVTSNVSVMYYGGINLNSNACEYYPEKYSMSTGFSAGFRLNVKLSPKTSIQTGLSFDRTGYALDDSSSVYYRYVEEGYIIYDVDTRVSIDYLTIPALVNFYIGRENRFYINTGPWLAFKLNARVTGDAYRGNRTTSEYTVSKIEVYDDIDAVVKDTDVGWMAGTGFLIPIGNNSAIDLGINYSRGFNDLLDRSYFNDSSPADTDQSVMKNSTISIRAGISIPVK
jgi:hypothetical protein